MHLVMGNLPKDALRLKDSGVRHHAVHILGQALHRGLGLRHPIVERRVLDIDLRELFEEVLSLFLNLVHAGGDGIHLAIDSLELLVVGLELGVMHNQVSAMLPG